MSFQMESESNHFNCASFFGLSQQKDVHATMQGEVHVGEVHEKRHASLISKFLMPNNQGQESLFYTAIIYHKNSRMTQTSLSESFMNTNNQTENQVTVPDEFHGDETLLTSHETSYFSFLAMSAKLMVFNIMKPSLKLPLRLALLPNLVII